MRTRATARRYTVARASAPGGNAGRLRAAAARSQADARAEPEQHEPVVANAGFWSALGIVVACAVFTVCFVAIPLTAPFYLWTDLVTYPAY